MNEDGTIAFVLTHSAENGSWKEETPFAFNADMIYRVASFWDKAGALFGGYFNWLGNLVQGEFGMSFKYKKPVQTVIVSNMGISFAIAFIATILQFAIAIPLGIKAATNQYGVVDYTVTVLTMMGISLPTFFLAAIVIRLFSVQLGWFPVNGLVSSLPTDASWFLRMGDMLWHMVLPMFVLVVLSVGSLMRYTRTNTHGARKRTERTLRRLQARLPQYHDSARYHDGGHSAVSLRRGDDHGNGVCDSRNREACIRCAYRRRRAVYHGL